MAFTGRGTLAPLLGWSDVEKLYAQHSRVVFRRARELLGDEQSAKDVVQEVFIRVMNSAGVIPSEPTPTAWLYRVTTNLCLNWLRDRSRRGTLLATRYPAAGHVQPTTETRVMVAAILERIPEDMQELAVHFFVDEMTYDEIARLMGKSRRTIGNKLADFRELVERLFPDGRLAS